MISLAFAILRSFLRDRPTLLMAIIAPIIFFLMFALFYRHIDSPQGIQFTIAIIGKSGRDADLFTEAMMRRQGDHTKVTRRIERVDTTATEHHDFDVVITLSDDFSRAHLSVDMIANTPFPGIGNAVRLLLVAASADAFATNNPTITIQDRTTAGGLLRSSTPGIPVLFVLFAISSLVARGLADEETGLAERFCSLGVSRSDQIVARIIALSLLAFAQMFITFLVAATIFDIMPSAFLSLGIATLAGSVGLATFMVALAGLCRSRARFALIAPVATLILGTLGGGIIPLKLLPPSIAWLSNWAFTGWTTVACAQAIDGIVPLQLICFLIAFDVVMLLVATSVASRGTSP